MTKRETESLAETVAFDREVAERQRQIDEDEIYAAWAAQDPVRWRGWKPRHK